MGAMSNEDTTVCDYWEDPWSMCAACFCSCISLLRATPLGWPCYKTSSSPLHRSSPPSYLPTTNVTLTLCQYRGSSKSWTRPAHKVVLGAETWSYGGTSCTRAPPPQKSATMGYLVHKSPPPFKVPPWGPGHRPTVGFKGGAVSYERGTPVLPAPTA